MKKDRKKAKINAKKNRKKSELDNHNTIGYLDDLNHICKLGRINPSTRDWIETNMLRLREVANVYEVDFASYLIKKKVKFIHQAPFILSGKIYFADFYLPDKNVIIEIDGSYHNGIFQSEKDKFRDECFNGNKIKVIRIPNSAVNNEKDLNILLNGLKK